MRPIDREGHLQTLDEGRGMNERRYIVTTQRQVENVSRFLKGLELSKPLELIVREYIEQRTTNQNSRLWSLHALASEVTGYRPDDLHELALKRFFGTKEVKVGDDVLVVPLKRSSMRDKKEFAAFMEATEQFYIEHLGVWLDKEAA